MEIFDKKRIVNDKIAFEGLQKLNNQDLLSLIIGRGAYTDTAYAKSSYYFEKLNGIENFTEEQLSKIRGISKNDKIFLASLVELANRIKERAVEEVQMINTNKDIFKIFSPIIGNLQHEELWIVTLNRNCRVIEKFVLSKGSMDNTMFDIKIVMKKVIDNLAASVILVHNHPSGDLKPSAEDIETSVMMKTALNYFDITLIDHVIINKETSYSMAINGDF